ncbi:MAG: hypothetical protein PHU53_04550 [Thermoplasmata archaeon]|nr:hypothetical protein [Thermoplasmata archaeon]
MSCKYYYRGGLCANSQMDKPFCVGEDKCSMLGSAMVKPELKQNTVVAQSKDDSMSQWLGVYCPHYQRFYCTGGADGCKSGCCATADDYEKSLAEHMEKYK